MGDVDTNAVSSPNKSRAMIGTIFAFPLYLITMFLIIGVTNFLFILIMGATDDPYSTTTAIASVISTIIGVIAAIKICDLVFKKWSAWPIFIFLIVMASFLLFSVLIFGEDDWWQFMLASIQAILAPYLTYRGAIQRKGF